MVNTSEQEGKQRVNKRVNKKRIGQKEDKQIVNKMVNKW